MMKDERIEMVRKFVVNNEDYNNDYDFPEDKDEILIEEYEDWKNSILDMSNIDNGNWIKKFIDFPQILLKDENSVLVIYDAGECYDFCMWCENNQWDGRMKEYFNFMGYNRMFVVRTIY